MSDKSEGLSRISSKESNNHKQGRSGGATPKKPGVTKAASQNRTQGGGINRPLKGLGAGS